MPADRFPLVRLLRKLEGRYPFEEADRTAILALPCTVRKVEAGAYLVREGDPPQRCTFIVAGFASRHKITDDGARQIVSLHVPGDLIDLQNLFLKVSDHNVQTLSRSEIGYIPTTAVQALSVDRPNVGKAMWIDTLIEASIFREWVVNVGRRDARARIAHLLCEFALRLDSAGLDGANGYDMPLTQDQIADCTGLTAVHVNRVLKSLTADGIITRDKRRFTVDDSNRLRQTAGFNDRYLHFDQGGG